MGLEVFGDPDSGPKGEKGSDERTSWFQEWTADLLKKNEDGGEMSQLDMIRMMIAQGGGGLPTPTRRRVIAADAATLKEAVEAHDALTWDDRIADVAEMEGEVITEDTSNSTMQVKFTSLDG